MAQIEIIIGSTLGSAEYVAEHMAEQLQAQQHKTTLHYKADLTSLLDNQQPDTIWLFVSSTHGAGQVPDNLQPFIEQFIQKQPQISTLRYAVIALGDRNYDTFCAAGQLIDQLMEGSAAQKIGDRLEIDVTAHEIPEDAADIWLSEWISNFN
jgi:MioC protein